jgi:hypothetical protein
LKLIAVGELVALKCYHILIEAVAEIINRSFEELMIIIAGDREEYLPLEESIRNLKLDRYVKPLGMRHNFMEFTEASEFLLCHHAMIDF